MGKICNTCGHIIKKLDAENCPKCFFPVEVLDPKKPINYRDLMAQDKDVLTPKTTAKIKTEPSVNSIRISIRNNKRSLEKEKATDRREHIKKMILKLDVMLKNALKEHEIYRKSMRNG